MPSAPSPLVDGEWTEFRNSAKQPHQQEPAEAWLDRLLGVEPSLRRAFRLTAEAVEVRAGDQAPLLLSLPASRRGVLASLSRRARGQGAPPGQAASQRYDGSSVILCDEGRDEFLLTRKDGLHPNPRCRGKLALVSGGAEPGESFRDAALRELYEEVRDVALADEAAVRLEELGVLPVPSVQWSGGYRLGVFVAAVPPAVFARWREAWAHDQVLSEATPARLTRAELQEAIAGELAAAGSRFVASQHEALRLALR